MDFIDLVKQEKETTEMMLRIFRKKVGLYPDKTLFERKMNGEMRYYYKIQGASKRYYIGWKEPELLRGLLQVQREQRAQLFSQPFSLFQLFQVLL